jgi:hypothetical protein
VEKGVEVPRKDAKTSSLKRVEEYNINKPRQKCSRRRELH